MHNDEHISQELTKMKKLVRVIASQEEQKPFQAGRPPADVL